MSELESSGLVMLILFASACSGIFVQRFLTDSHRSRETRELSSAVTSMLVTLAALVLGLLTNSVKQSFDQAASDLRAYSVELIELSGSLRAFGPEAAPALEQLRSYIASAIASTWSGEPKPAGANIALGLEPAPAPHPRLESPQLGAILNQVADEIRRLPTSDALHAGLAATARVQVERLIQDRWTLIEEAHTSIPMPFYRVLVFWLIIVFASLGLTAPRNVLVFTLLALAAVAIASVVFAIMEMDTPFTGMIQVSSQPMRDALAHMSP